MACTTAGHGLRYIGRRRFGFRTDRCPRSWAAEDPLVGEALHGHGWMQNGGGFAAWAGTHPPAVLLRAIEFYAVESSWRVLAESKAEVQHAPPVQPPPMRTRRAKG